MVQVDRHINRLECYGCHATWAPQCYGCHIKVDYKKRNAHLDWVALGHHPLPNGLTPEYTAQEDRYRIHGEIQETRSYLRWEYPALAQNGEGRIGPVVPGCQTTVTVINDQGDVILSNNIFRIPDVEGAGPMGQRAIDTAPLHPHTVQKAARQCETCHVNPKALGYGIDNGILYADPAVDHFIDLTTGPGQIIPEQVHPQITAIPGLTFDLSRFVDEQGKQLQTVGHHLKLSQPLSNRERSHMEREGVCVACHQEIPDRSLAVSILHHVAEVSGLMPESNPQHKALLKKSLLIAGWAQVAAIAIGTAAAGLLFVWFMLRRRKRV